MGADIERLRCDTSLAETAQRFGGFSMDAAVGNDFVSQVIADMRTAGMDAPSTIICDGHVHRFVPEPGRSDTAWYAIHIDPVRPWWVFGDWRTGKRHNGSAALSRVISSAELDEWRKRKRAVERRIKADNDRFQAGAAIEAHERWKRCGPAPDGHEYLRAKQVKSYGLRLDGEALLVPMRDADGRIWSLQEIWPDGRKHNQEGARRRGCFAWIAAAVGAVLLICEGYATGATLHAATGYPVASAGDAGNLEPVARALREKYPAARIVVCGDDDWLTRVSGQPHNTGVISARKAAAAVNGAAVFPWLASAARPRWATDFNDQAKLHGTESVSETIRLALIDDDERHNTKPSGSPDWRIDLQEGKSGFLSNLFNAHLAVAAAPELKDVFRYDEMARAVVVTRAVPGYSSGGEYPRGMTDAEADAAQKWIQQNSLPNMAKAPVRQAIGMAARERAFHPVRDYLNALQWDGSPRLDTWLHECFGVELTAYTAAIGRMFLISMVARIFRPGCKVDYMLVLEGGQGAEKSKVCRILAGDRWFSDTLPDITSKDAAQHLRGKWLIEAAEMHALSKADASRLKQFLTVQIEKYRPAYGEYEVEEPRQVVFIGTTNEAEYLRDHTGSRRFWPVAVKQIDAEWMQANRDQLMAEAVQCFTGGEQWWPDRDFELEHIKPEQEARREVDVWTQAIGEYVTTLPRVTVWQVAKDALKIETARIGTADQRRISAGLVVLGWRRGPRQGVARWWLPPESASPPDDGDVEF